MADPTTTVEVEDDAAVTVDIDGMFADAGLDPENPPKNGAEPAAKAGEDAAKSAADQAAAILAETSSKLEAERKAREAADATAAAERRRADQAAQLARQREQEVHEALEGANNAQLVIINNGIASATRDLESAKRDFKVAHENGDADKMADAQVAIGKAAAALDRLNDAKDSFEVNARRPAAAVEQQQQASPFEGYVSNFQPRAQRWLREHPECVPAQVGGNAQKNAAMMQGHYAALAQSIPEGSERYFEIIEEHTGYRTPATAAAATTEGAVASPTSAAAAVKPATPANGAAKRTPQPSAPVTRDPAGGDGRPQSQRVVLTKEQQDAALMSFSQRRDEDDTAFRKRAFGEYARGLIEARAAGKIGRMSH